MKSLLYNVFGQVLLNVSLLLNYQYLLGKLDKELKSSRFKFVMIFSFLMNFLIAKRIRKNSDEPLTLLVQNLLYRSQED